MAKSDEDFGKFSESMNQFFRAFGPVKESINKLDLTLSRLLETYYQANPNQFFTQPSTTPASAVTSTELKPDEGPEDDRETHQQNP